MLTKADQAQAILLAGGVISVQVHNEVASECLRKFKMPWLEIEAMLKTKGSVPFFFFSTS